MTSARILADRLPPRSAHQYVPVDTPDAVARFLDHWRPDAALWVESELWPNLLVESRRRGIPLALVNARMSQRSFRRWGRLPGLVRPLLTGFAVTLAQSEADGARYTALGARDVRVVGDLKAIAAPLAAEPEVILCDEVTSALDPLVAEEILKLLDRLQDEFNLSYMFITHDLATVRAIADEVVVMHRGTVVESGPKSEMFTPPHHDYTDLLLSSIPEMDPDWLDKPLAERAELAKQGRVLKAADNCALVDKIRH